MRGLKRDVRRWYYRRESVASFTDAWIETMMARVAKALALSHLLQMRGLKPGNRTAAPTSRRSHLLQMRGLKHYLSNVPNSYIVSHLLQMRGLKLVQQWRAFGAVSYTHLTLPTTPYV